jgi:hypothetical protein
VRQYLATSRNVKPVIPTRRAHASHLRSGGRQRKKINPAITD